MRVLQVWHVAMGPCIEDGGMNFEQVDEAQYVGFLVESSSRRRSYLWMKDAERRDERLVVLTDLPQHLKGERDL